MPFARKFVATDGESLEVFMPEKSLSSPTVACSEASPLEAFFACNGDSQQIKKEPRRVPMNINCGLDMYDSAANALRTALLLDDDEDLKCDVCDSAVNALRTSVQFNDDEGRVQFDDDSIDLDLPSRLIRSDTDLMNTESPGAMRLTEKGLERHERKSFKGPIYSPHDAPEGYMEWKRQQEMRKWWKQTKQKAIERELGATPKPSNAADEKSLEKSVVVPAIPTRQKRPWFWFKKTAELLETPHNGVDVSDSDSKSTQRLSKSTHQLRLKDKSDRFFGTKQQEFQHVNQRRKATSDRFLGKKQQEVQPVNEVKEDREQRHIEELRRKELERQRKREADARKKLPSKICSPEGIDVMNEPRTTRELSANKSTRLSTSVSTLPCVVCSRGERTHIATPCMHFSFCEPCAKRLDGMPCPVCGSLCPTYNRVFA